MVYTFSVVRHSLGVVVHGWCTSEEAHQVEVEERTESVCLATIYVVVVVGESGGIRLVDVAYHDVEVGDGIVGAVPNTADGTLHAAVGIVVL